MFVVRNIFLTLLYYLRFKSRFSVLRDFDLHSSVTAVYTFPLVAIAIIIIVRTLGFLVSKMIIHFRFHHFFVSAE